MNKLRTRSWKERMEMLLQLPLPDRALKYLPPDFVLRDPVMSLVEQARKRGDYCALLYFCPEEPFSPCPLPPMPLTKGMRGLFSETLEHVFGKRNILGVKRLGSEDITVFIRSEEPFSQADLKRKTEEIRRELEQGIGEFAGTDWGARLQLIASFCTIEAYPSSAPEAVQAAFRYAQALANRKLPDNFADYRQQMIHILNTEGISVFTQPIMSLQDGDLLGWEVLTRGPEGGPFHFPDDLFEFAQQAGLLVPMEYLVIKKAIREISRMQIREQVFLNVTPVTLSHPYLLDQMSRWIEEYPGIRPDQIILEITERHAIKDFSHMAGVIDSFRKKGFRIAIDDAGAGYASLQIITELVPDIIKIDKSVIRDIDRETVKQSLLEALLHLAKNINCKVVAEGVERVEEADVLCRNRVHMGQGYFFSRPQPLHHTYGNNHFAQVKETIIRLQPAV